MVYCGINTPCPTWVPRAASMNEKTAMIGGPRIDRDWPPVGSSALVVQSAVQAWSTARVAMKLGKIVSNAFS